MQYILIQGLAKMAKEQNTSNYINKALTYDMISQYYKYIDPNKHIYYYQKHLQYIHLVHQSMRIRNDPAKELQRMNKGKLRIFHGSPNAGEVDIYLNGLRIFKELPYKEMSNYLSLLEGKYQLDIYPANTMVSPILSRKIIIEAGAFHSAAFSGESNDSAFAIFKDDLTIPRGESKMQFIHLAADCPPLGVSLDNGETVFSATDYRGNSGFLALSPMVLNLNIIENESGNVLLALREMTVKPQTAFSLIVTGSITDTPPLEVLVIEN